MTQSNFYVKPWCHQRGRRLWKFYLVKLGLSFLPTLSGNFATSLGFCQGRALRLACDMEGERESTNGSPRAAACLLSCTFTPGALVSFPVTNSGLFMAEAKADTGSFSGPASRDSGWGGVGASPWRCRIQRKGPGEASRRSRGLRRGWGPAIVLSSHPFCFLFLFLPCIVYSGESFPLRKRKPTLTHDVSLKQFVDTQRFSIVLMGWAFTRKFPGLGGFRLHFFLFYTLSHPFPEILSRKQVCSLNGWEWD